MEKKGTSASPATALASNVLPVPGGPTSKAPLGILPPKSVYFLGFLRNSTISCTSILAPSCPATSLKVTRSLSSSLSFFSCSLARLLPTLKMPSGPLAPSPPPALRMMKIHRKMKNRIGPKFQRKRSTVLSEVVYFTSPRKCPRRCCSSTNSSSLSLLGYSVTSSGCSFRSLGRVPKTSVILPGTTCIESLPSSLLAVMPRA